MKPKRSAGPSLKTVPKGDNRTRLVCQDCGYIAYTNPKIVVGAVCTWQSKILFCRRAIEPGRGLWTIPAGFLESGETASSGAAREVLEEAGARVSVGDLLGIYEIPHISQVMMIYKAEMLDDAIAAGVESQAVALLDWSEIPWQYLAFPSVRWALDHYRGGEGVAFHVALKEDQPGEVGAL
jgi:ADP-ribose pyrophosphatase YjhB (NUDIX family)